MIVQKSLSAQPRKLISKKGFLISLGDQQRRFIKIGFTVPWLQLDLLESPFSEQRCSEETRLENGRDLTAAGLCDSGHCTFSAGWWKAQLTRSATEAFA